MTPALDVHPLKSRIGDFIAGLQDLEHHPITTSLVLDFLADMRPSPEALAPYIWWSSERYTRNLIYRDHRFEVLALCWMPGQHTPIHTHNGQLGWVTVVQGELECRDYRFIKPPAEPTLPAKNSAVAQARTGLIPPCGGGTRRPRHLRRRWHRVRRRPPADHPPDCQS